MAAAPLMVLLRVSSERLELAVPTLSYQLQVPSAILCLKSSLMVLRNLDA